MLDLVRRRPRFEAPVIAFVVVVLAAYFATLWWSWTAVAVDQLRGGEGNEVADTGIAC
jgi:hypothetical protein